MSLKSHRVIYVSLAIIVLIILVIVCSGNNDKEMKEQRITNLVKSYSSEISFMLVSLEDIPDYITFPLGNTTFRETDLKDILRLIVRNDDEIYGSTCAFEPYKFKGDTFYFAPYYYKQNDSVYYKDLSGEDYDYFSWNWYLIPKRSGKAFWTEPYFDEGGGNIDLITYSAPIYKYNDESKEFMGVITVDVTLNWINNIVDHLEMPKNGFSLLVSKLGTVISTDKKNKSWRLKETIFSLAEENNWNSFKEIGQRIIKGGIGEEYFTSEDGNSYFVSYAPIPESNWSFLIAVKQDKI